jgi:hypothetical protein
MGMNIVLSGIRTINELLTAGIAITAFSLLLYALTFNLRDRVARSFAIILTCVVIVFVSEAIGSTATAPHEMEVWLRLQWIGIILLPAAYIHFSDALLATTGRPSRGRRRRLVIVGYLISAIFLALLPTSRLVGEIIHYRDPAPHLQHTSLTWVFTLYYLAALIFAWINFIRADRRTVTRTSRRRLRYLLAGALAPALGSYPYLLFGSEIAVNYPWLFWAAAVLSNLMVSALLVLMAYAVAFFGVAWPDRVVKRRLFKWLMRGPVTACTVLAITTVARRAGLAIGISYPAAIPILMVASVLMLQHLITLIAPLWERWLFHGGDRGDLHLLQSLEERLLTSGDLRDFLESVLAAVCDRLQVNRAFLVALGPDVPEMLLTVGEDDPFADEDISADMLQVINQNGGKALDGGKSLVLPESEMIIQWRDYWLVPLYDRQMNERSFLGILGAARIPDETPDDEQLEALMLLARRAALALEDRRLQRQLFTSLQALTPQVDLIQRLRAAARYDGVDVLTDPNDPTEVSNLSKWVKDALTHYWGGPKLSQSPLLRLRIVQTAIEEHQGNPTNALRAILRKAVDRVRPEGERRFTAEWILYNILEMKFMEGRKVREIAMRLAMSEADLYRKQRVAIEAVVKAILAMEQELSQEQLQK